MSISAIVGVLLARTKPLARRTLRVRYCRQNGLPERHESPFASPAESPKFSELQAKVDSNPIAQPHPPQTSAASFLPPYRKRLRSVPRLTRSSVAEAFPIKASDNAEITRVYHRAPTGRRLSFGGAIPRVSPGANLNRPSGTKNEPRGRVTG